MPAHYLDFPCGDCGAKAQEPCHRARYPHKARRDLRDEARGDDPWIERQLDRIEDEEAI